MEYTAIGKTVFKNVSLIKTLGAQVKPEKSSEGNDNLSQSIAKVSANELHLSTRFSANV